MEKKRILCFGDSLTWGYNPETHVRFPEEDRWTTVLQEILGDDYKVIDEGQNGRTIAIDDPSEGEKNGLNYIGPCLESQRPLDLVIIMLGSNDCKRKFAFSSMDIAGEMQIFLEKVVTYNHFRCRDQFKILLISPPHISEKIKDSWLGDCFGYERARELSMELSSWYQKLADMYDCLFMDAADYVKASDIDGCHLDAENQKKLGKAVVEFLQKADAL